MGAPERDPAPDAERPRRRIGVDHRPVGPGLAAEDDRPVGREGVGVAGPREPEREMGPVEVEESHRSGPAGGGRWGRQWRRRSIGGRVVDEEVRAAEAAIALAALGVEDPELRPPPRRAEPVAGDGHLGLLADDVAPEADPRSAGELEAEAGRLGDGRGEAAVRPGGSRATSSVSARRARAARRRSRSATFAAVVPGSGRGGRSITSRSTERPASSAPAIDRPSSSVSGVRTTSQSSRTPRATASTGSRARARSSQATIAPSAWASATRRRARVVLPELASPRRATLALRGRPPGPRIASSAGNPVRTIRSTVPWWAAAPRPAPPRQRRRRQRPDDPRSCRAPACLEGRQSSRHVRGKRRHRSILEQMF